MKAEDLVKNYLDFFKTSPRNHKYLNPAPLILPEDSTTLFTSSGMQQLVPYLKGEPHPQGRRLVNVQPSVRAQGINDDINEVGDNRHFTYFEMLGNWSLGDYYKEEQLAWFWEFLTRKMNIPKKNLWISVFEGNSLVKKDTQSIKIWRSIGIPKERIFEYGVDKNWWSRSGPPKDMPEGEIGGPDSEVFFENEKITHNPAFGKSCHPNCECGRFIEIGNSVFIQYQKKDAKLIELKQKNVDFGGGMERLLAVASGLEDVYDIDLLKKYIQKVQDLTGVVYQSGNENAKYFRIISDHIRASEKFIGEGIEPSNKLHGYILRRLIRRSVLSLKRLKKEILPKDLCLAKEDRVNEVIELEVGRFLYTLEKGLKIIQKINKIDAKKAFDLYQTYGFPIEITSEIFEEKGQNIDINKYKEEFEKHKKLSRAKSSQVFKGGLADHSESVKKLHTTTHLLHSSLRRVLGTKISQKGSNITKERLRFDFSHDQKLTVDQIDEVQRLINTQIKKDLPIKYEVMDFKKALQEGALAFFKDKYKSKVKVYSIGKGKDNFSKEVCAGPHVSSTGEIGHVKIGKQKKIGANIIRLYAQIDK